MPERWSTEQFEAERTRLRGIAYRMLGSMSEADDAVQETWLRLQRTDEGAIDNLAAWCTTVITRVCLNLLRSRSNRREDSMGVHVPDPVVTEVDRGPEHDALAAESVGLALLVVLETLSPAERVAFVLHDVFAVPFEEIAEVLDRTPAAARQLASRARRRVQANPTQPDADQAEQRAVVDAFFAAARAGDLEGLLRVLDPDVVRRGPTAAGGPSRLIRGADTVARGSLAAVHPAATFHPVLVNGNAGVVIAVQERPVAVLGFTVRDGRIAAIDVVNEPERIAALDLPNLS